MADLRIERVVVTGGRRFSDKSRIEADLRALLPFGLRRLAHGVARGADLLAEAAWRRIDLDGGETVYFHADWENDGKAAGPRRNIRMLEAERPDLVLAYPDPDSRGTWHCVAEAIKRGIPVIAWVEWARLPGAAQNACCEVHRHGVTARRVLDLSSSSWAYCEFNVQRVGIDADTGRRSALLKVLHA